MTKFMNDELRRIRDNLVCSHCSEAFVGTDSQARKIKYENQKRVFCSKDCRLAFMSQRFKKKLPTYGPCPTCGEMFTSKYPKTFCSLKCYNKSPEFKEMARKNCAKGKETQGKEWAEKMEKECPVCRKNFRADRSHRKFCSRGCYREFCANMFDYWVATPPTIEEMQNFDEFLEQEELTCPIDGCEWHGKNLSLHLIYSHGIRPKDFKMQAGFNLNTGLVSSETRETLSNRPLQGVASDEELQAKGKEALAQMDDWTGRYRSKEAIEHIKKSIALSHATEKGPIRSCPVCGEEFQQTTKFGKTIYCSIKCRNRKYNEDRKKHTT